jgi:hypothetical protein
MIFQNNTLTEAADLVTDCTVLYKDERGEYIEGAVILKKLKVCHRIIKRNSDPAVSN